jgi:hypothetical protein
LFPPEQAFWIGIVNAEGKQNRQSIADARDALGLGAAAAELAGDGGEARGYETKEAFVQKNSTS